MTSQSILWRKLKDPLGKVKFVHLFKVTVLNLHVILIKPKVNYLIILAARLYWS